ncbi:nucleoside triphosphate pyrophosphohydrolase [bacterium]|nr:nucleoside triphosphate pyrophosphohydrolase [bacterium]
MAALRGPGGCPWDREQTHESLKKYLIEEAYEAVDAIDDGDPKVLAEELGDVLLQVVFHAQMGSEAGRFDIGTVLDAINGKMLSRHPHVFGQDKLETAEAVLRRWEDAKNEEKAHRKSILEDIPSSLPALMKAHLIQDRVRRVGFDWENVEQVFDKLEEELAEFRQAIREGEKTHVREELGDLLFALVNVARFIGEEPEVALQRTNHKFMRRFAYVEQKIRERGLSLEQAGLALMDQYWEEAKTEIPNGDVPKLGA